MDYGAFALDHTRATELFSAYWDEDLSAADLSALEEHLKSCVVCRREYQTFERTVGAVGQLHPMMAPPDFAESVRTRIRKRSRGPSSAPENWPNESPTSSF